MTDIPMIHTWRGKIIEEMSREELIGTVVEMGNALNENANYERDRRDAFGAEIRERARKLKERAE